MIVVDTNVLAYLFLPGAQTRHATALFEADPDWAAPLRWRSEFRNILSGFMRRSLISLDQACSLQCEAKQLVSRTEFNVESELVLELVDSSDCSAYDCEFVALAIMFGKKLVTEDKKLRRAFPTHTLALVA